MWKRLFFFSIWIVSKIYRRVIYSFNLVKRTMLRGHLINNLSALGLGVVGPWDLDVDHRSICGPDWLLFPTFTNENSQNRIRKPTYLHVYAAQTRRTPYSRIPSLIQSTHSRAHHYPFHLSLLASQLELKLNLRCGMYLPLDFSDTATNAIGHGGRSDLLLLGHYLWLAFFWGLHSRNLLSSESGLK